MTAEPRTAPRVTHPETKAETVVEVSDPPAMGRFQEVPNYVYWHDPYYVPPLAAEERGFFDPAKNPFFKRGEARLFVASHGRGKPVARVAAAIDRDYDARHGKKHGFFGFLEFLGDARLPEILLGEAVRWLRERGAEEIVGPCRFTPDDPGAGLLIEGFDDDPTLDTVYNPVNYHGFMARLPIEKWRDLYGYEVAAGPPPERLSALAARARERRGIAVRPLDLHAAKEIEAARALCDEAWAGSPQRAPIGGAELASLAGGRHGAIDPALVLLAEEKGRPVGLAAAIPDWNRVLKHLNGSLLPFGWLKAILLKRTIDRVRVVTFGALGKGPVRAARAAVLADAVWRAVAERGYARADLSPISEDDAPAIGLAEALGARHIRTWRLFRVLPGAFA
jgi:hypothetical protein